MPRLLRPPSSGGQAALCLRFTDEGTEGQGADSLKRRADLGGPAGAEGRRARRTRSCVSPVPLASGLRAGRRSSDLLLCFLAPQPQGAHSPARGSSQRCFR